MHAPGSQQRGPLEASIFVEALRAHAGSFVAGALIVHAILWSLAPMISEPTPSPKIALGLAAAMTGPILDVAITRLMDLIMAVPSLVLAVLVVAVLGPSLANTIIAVTIVYLPGYVRLARASALGELNKDYVTAARVVGVGPLRLAYSTVLPNCLAPLIVQAALGVSSAILEAAALGFLGLGAQPPTPEWGSMLADSREFIRSDPWIVALPGLAILITVVAINLTGDGLRDALDPKMRRG